MIRYSWQLCITSRLHPCIFTKYSTSRKMWQLIPILIARVSARTTALHSACVAGQRAHRVSWRLISSVCWRHAGSPTAQPLFDCGSCVTTYSSMQTSLRVWGGHSWHCTSAPVGCYYPRSRGGRQQAAGCAKAEVARRKTIDSHLRFDCHAKEVVRACNYHTRALRHVRTVLTDDLAQTVACSIVGSRLDYCNAMLYGAPAATFDVLQWAQNNLARVVCQRGGRTTGCQSSIEWHTRWRRWR